VERRDVILIHPEDMKRLGLKAGVGVRVTSEIGAMENMLVHSFADIKPGNAAMYYPEANALVPRRIDPLSKTPAFKCVVVSVEPMPERADERSKKGSKGREELVTIVPADSAKSSRDQMRAC
jgi:formylmethanofuran dehydrogenase subunit D